MQKRIIILERLGGSLLFFQTRIIYMIFLLINWLSFLLVKLFQKTSKAIDKFISDSLNEIYQTNLYLTGIKEERIRWNSLDDVIAGIFYPLLIHGFLFCFFLLYAYLAILQLSDNPLYMIANPYPWTTDELVHSIISILVIYLPTFLFFIPYYIKYPNSFSDKKATQIWKEIGFTIKYPLRDIFIIIFYTSIFLILYYGAIQELIETKTITFDFTILRWNLIAGIFWSIAEEITFRGYLIAGLQRKTNNILTIAISSVLFGLYHILQAFHNSLWGIWSIMLNAFIIGILLAVFRVKSKSFIGSFIIHLFDYILFLGSFNLYYKIIPISSHFAYDIVLMLIICTLTIVLIFLIYPKKKMNSNNNSIKKNLVEDSNTITNNKL